LLHSGDTHCTDLSQHHLHEGLHHCLLCDMSVYPAEECSTYHLLVDFIDTKQETLSMSLPYLPHWHFQYFRGPPDSILS